MVTEKERDIFPDILRGILTILVFVCHTLARSVGEYGGGVLFNAIWSVQMPGFFIISGYFGYKKMSSSEIIKNEIGKACRSLLLPFLSWFLLSDILLGSGNAGGILEKTMNLVFHVDQGLWFLWALFVIRLMFIPINKILNRADKGMIQNLMWAIFAFCGMDVLLLLVALKMGTGFLGMKYILYYSVFYAVGYGIRLFRKELGIIEAKLGDILFLITAVCIAAIVWKVDLYGIEDNAVGIMIRFFAGCIAAYVLFKVCKKWKKQLKAMRIDSIGRYSLEIYVTHVTLLGIFSNTKLHLFTVNGTANFLMVAFWLGTLTALVIAVLKSGRYTNLLFYGKCSNKW